MTGAASNGGAETMNAEGKYIYCIIQCNAEREFSFRGVGGRDGIYTINFEDLAAVVSDSPIVRYDISRENTMAHERVIEGVMQRGFTVLPVRFGTIAQNADQVRERLLRRRFGLLHGLLHQVENKVELGLKAFWNKERIFREIVEEEPEIKVYRDALAQRSSEQTYTARIELGKMVEAALITKRDREAEQILNALRPVADEIRVNPLLGDTMVLNAAFLVRRNREAEFDAQVNALDEKYAGRITFKYIGPVPPFNFVKVVVNWNED
jgi:hypothetical protein